MAEQILPMVHGEKVVMLGSAKGFMMYLALALQVLADSGQHWEESCRS